MIVFETQKQKEQKIINNRDIDKALSDIEMKCMDTIITIMNNGFSLLEKDKKKIKTDSSLFSEKHDIELEIDIKLGNMIVSTLQDVFPDHSIISEENGTITGSGDYTWIIDPLDGSVNYFYGLPFYGISIACFHQQLKTVKDKDYYDYYSILNHPVIGAVLIPFEKKLYWAINGKGAFCNSETLHCPNNKKIQEIMLSMNFSGRKNNMDQMTTILSQLVNQVKKIRSHGATAIDLAYIASGTIGALIQRGIKVWDFAAAYIILQEAGGKIKLQEREKNNWDLIASLPNLHNQLIETTKLF